MQKGHTMLEIITTKYHGATNFRGSRISATGDGARVSIPYPHELNGEAVHAAAARALAAKLGFHGVTLKGYSTQKGYTFFIA
jgi:hypothetical protein